MNEIVSVLLVEDNPGDARLIRIALSETGSTTRFELTVTDSLSKAFESLTAGKMDAILLDLNLPDSQGLNSVVSMAEKAPDLPIIVMTGLDDEALALQALQKGAQDYLVKNQLDGNLLRRTIRYAIERTQTEQTLRESQARLSGIIGSAMDAIITIDEEQRITLFNPAAEAMFQHSANDVLGKPLTTLIPQRLRSKHEDDVNAFGETSATKRSMGRLGMVYGLRGNNEEFPIEASISKIEASSKKIFTAVLRDITERKQAEMQIQHQLQRLNSLRTIDTAISSSFDIHVTLDIVLQQVLAQLRVDAVAILLLNPQMQTIEYAASQGLRSTVLRSTQLQLNEGHAGRAVQEGRTIHIPDLLKAGGKLAEAMQSAGEGFVDYYGTPLLSQNEVKGVLEIYHRTPLPSDPEWLDFLETMAGQAAIAIDNAQLFDKLQRSNAELEGRVAKRTAELDHTNAELEHANRAKDEFLANMSHELRTPLNSILGLSESLLEQRRGSLNDSQQKSLGIIETSGHHLLDLINDILDLSKIEAGKFDYYPQVVDVDNLCRSSLSFVKEQAARKSITLNYNNKTSVPEVSADPRRLKQILVNLLTNAVKFTPDNGQVALEVRTDSERELIQISVVDTGIGISPEDLKRLFTPFVQVDSSLNRQFEGTGLGLALVEKLTDLHSGSLEVESQVGKGSRFTVNLHYKQYKPGQFEQGHTAEHLLINEQAEGIAFEPEGKGPSAARHKILLAEDNDANILTVGEYLESYGYEILVAHDGLEAIQMAQESTPNIILMDIQMPLMNGLEAIQRLRADPRFASTPIIALTALAMVGDRERCLEAGATEYLSKPVSLRALRRMIEALLTDVIKKLEE